MKHIWSVLCQKSSIDKESNLISLFDCVEEINLVIDQAKAPKNDKIIIPIEFQLVSFWVFEDINKIKDNVLEIKIELLDPDKKLLGQFENKFKIKKGISRFRSRITIKGLRITKKGRYTYKVRGKDEGEKGYKVVAELPLDLKLAYKFPQFNKK